MTPPGIQPITFKLVKPLRDSGSNNCQYVSEVFNAIIKRPRQLSLPTDGHTNAVRRYAFTLTRYYVRGSVDSETIVQSAELC